MTVLRQLVCLVATKELVFRNGLYEKTFVRAGLANVLSNFTSILTLDEDDDEPIVVGDCDEAERYLRLLRIAWHNASRHDQDILYWWK